MPEFLKHYTKLEVTDSLGVDWQVIGEGDTSKQSMDHALVETLDLETKGGEKVNVLGGSTSEEKFPKTLFKNTPSSCAVD